MGGDSSRGQMTVLLSAEQLERLGATADRLGVARAELGRWAVLHGLAQIEQNLLGRDSPK